VTRNRLGVIITAAVLGAGGLGAGLAFSLGGAEDPIAQGLKPASTKASYTFYLSIAKRFSGQGGQGYGPMMGGGYGSIVGGGGHDWMMGQSGYDWMMGGSRAPGWMMGGSLPSSVTRGYRDMGRAMGALFANAPGPRVSPPATAKLGVGVPSGATVNKTANTVTFAGQKVSFAVIASPSMPAEDFEVAGLTDPTIVVPLGAQVQVELVNADGDMAHGFVVADQGAQGSWMPMMTAAPAFSGSALWFLGEATSTGMHAGTVSFAASRPGTYSYVCPVPGHAQEGMAGIFVVQPSPAD
jgi:rusticyanin